MNEFLEVTNVLLDITVFLSFAGIAVALALLLYRIVAGPTQADRAAALDAMGINLMGLAGLTAIHLVTSRLNDVVLLIGVLAFLGTLAIAKYMEKGVIIDRDME
ncbi:monovalent cation/H+ antiporter complex subunit F [Virgibacillus xinjiangensis]|uniref:Monovalent cation/H+ antiporter complex subunit F n=1 Tax=Virgibacillus xinjiangensis TaxID=393090 RepID=A0ABV7CS84_9BACI